jgi:hypothetical protein
MQRSPRYLLVNKSTVIDTETGEAGDELTEELLIRDGRGGVIVGSNLYPLIATFIDTARNNGWAVKIHAQEQRTSDPKRVRGILYASHLTHKSRKQTHGKRKQTTVKWLVLNLELFGETEAPEKAARALVKLANQRGIAPRYSPGSFGSALLRSSPEWWRGRQPAPWFISEAARAVLPGNYYARRRGYTRIARGYYIDQQSAHHTVASQIDLPDPRYLRARGRFRQVELDRSPEVYRHQATLDKHVGVIVARVQCGHVPLSQAHLYPEWAREFGSYVRWIWTPELRLIDSRIHLQHVTAMLTSIRPDPALREYANWSLARLAEPHNPAIKPAMLAAYGMLAVKSNRDLTMYSAHGRKKPDRAEIVSLPLLDNVYRSTVRNRRVPSTQNVVARGVIEAEVRVRSIEMARQFESEKVPVVHIYADGLIVQADQLPFLPNGWRAVAALTDVSAPAPHSILSREMIRLPGIPNGRRQMYMRKDRDGLHFRENEPSVSGKVLL